MDDDDLKGEWRTVAAESGESERIGEADIISLADRLDRRDHWRSARVAIRTSGAWFLWAIACWFFWSEGASASLATLGLSTAVNLVLTAVAGAAVYRSRLALVELPSALAVDHCLAAVQRRVVVYRWFWWGITACLVVAAMAAFFFYRVSADRVFNLQMAAAAYAVPLAIIAALEADRLRSELGALAEEQAALYSPGDQVLPPHDDV